MIRKFFGELRGKCKLIVTFEEGTLSQWLYEIINPKEFEPGGLADRAISGSRTDPDCRWPWAKDASKYGLVDIPAKNNVK